MTLIFDKGLPYNIFLFFPDLRELEISTERTHCNCCDTPQLLHSKWRNMHKPSTIFLGNITVQVCTKRCPITEIKYKSEQYNDLIPANGVYGYDVIRRVGDLRFRESFQDKKIQKVILEEEHLFIPLSTISHLAKKDIDYIAAVHYENSDILKKFFAENGLVLHADGTYEGNTGIHFSMRDSVSGVVLYNVKIKSENEKDIIDAINKCVEHFGQPVAVVCDLSLNIMNAVKAVLKKTPLLICHYHFLENVGNKLLLEEKQELAKIIKAEKIMTYLANQRKALSKAIKKEQEKNGKTLKDGLEEFNNALNNPKDSTIKKEQYIRYFALHSLQWIADYEYSLNGEYFPFSIREIAFINKCKEFVKRLNEIISNEKKEKLAGAISAILSKLNEFFKNEKLNTCLDKIKNGVEIFNDTRDFFRLNSSQNKPLQRGKIDKKNDDIITELKQKMEVFKSDLNKKSKKDKLKKYAEIVLTYLEKYEDNLTGHVVKYQYNGNEKSVTIPRTNNIMETLFGSFKRKLRQKIGCKKLTNHFKGMHPDEFLLENLSNPIYLKLLYNGSIDNLIKKYPEVDKKAKAIYLSRKTNKNLMDLKKKTLRNKNFINSFAKSFENFLKTA